MTLSAPIWIVALALGACGPWFVRAFADALEARVRRRTEALVARAVRALPRVTEASEEGEG
jgi:hypothetical protein